MTVILICTTAPACNAWHCSRLNMPTAAYINAACHERTRSPHKMFAQLLRDRAVTVLPFIQPDQQLL